MLVAIEGIDGAGKRTATKNAAEALRRRGLDVSTISFPQYGLTQASRSIAALLDGKDSVEDPRAVARLFAQDRFETVSSGRFPSGLVICDRYTASNAAFQLARLNPSEWREFAAWLSFHEFQELGLPVPEVSILLQLEADLARKRVLRKARRSYTSKKLDRFEMDRGYQSRVAEAYQFLVDSSLLSDWKVVAMARFGEPRPSGEVAAEITEIIESRLRVATGTSDG